MDIKTKTQHWAILFRKNHLITIIVQNIKFHKIMTTEKVINQIVLGIKKKAVDLIKIIIRCI